MPAIAKHKDTGGELLERYETLTADEKDVLRLTVLGKPDKAIALKLDLEPADDSVAPRQRDAEIECTFACGLDPPGSKVGTAGPGSK